MICGLVACGKKKGSTAAVVTPTAGYVTCPAQGYIQTATGTQQCQPGTTVYTGVGGVGGQQLCPQQGYIQTQYGMQQCYPGQYVNVTGGGYPGQFPGGQQYGNCQTWYGPGWYESYYMGQRVCMRMGY